MPGVTTHSTCRSITSPLPIAPPPPISDTKDSVRAAFAYARRTALWALLLIQEWSSVNTDPTQTRMMMPAAAFDDDQLESMRYLWTLPHVPVWPPCAPTCLADAAAAINAYCQYCEYLCHSIARVHLIPESSEEGEKEAWEMGRMGYLADLVFTWYGRFRRDVQPIDFARSTMAHADEGPSRLERLLAPSLEHILYRSRPI
jgi:hypothetical protein